MTRKAPAKTPILTDEHRTALAATVEAGPKPDMEASGAGGGSIWRRGCMRNRASRSVVRCRDGTFAPWGSPWGSPSSPPARSTTHSTTRPARRSTKRLRRRRPHPQPMGRHADRAPGSGQSPDGSEEQTHATPGAAGDAAPRAARSADRRGLSLRRPWCDTHPMAEPLKLIGQQVEAGAHALLILDRAGGQTLTQRGCPRQHHPRPTAAKGTRGEPGRERLAVHPGHLAFDPRFQDLRRHRRSLLPSLEHPQASTRARHLNRRARRGPSGGSVSDGIRRPPPRRTKTRSAAHLFISFCGPALIT